MKEKIKLLYFAELLKEFEKVVLGDLGVEVADPEAVPVLQGALGQDGGILQEVQLRGGHGCKSMWLDNLQKTAVITVF